MQSAPSRTGTASMPSSAPGAGRSRTPIRDPRPHSRPALRRRTPRCREVGVARPRPEGGHGVVPIRIAAGVGGVAAVLVLRAAEAALVPAIAALILRLVAAEGHVVHVGRVPVASFVVVAVGIIEHRQGRDQYRMVRRRTTAPAPFLSLSRPAPSPRPTLRRRRSSARRRSTGSRANDPRANVPRANVPPASPLRKRVAERGEGRLVFARGMEPCSRTMSEK